MIRLCRLDELLRRSATLLVVSHRPEVAELADRVWRLEGGELAAAAPPRTSQAQL